MSPALIRALVAADWDEAGQLLGAEIPEEWRREDWQWLGQRPEQAGADALVRPWLPRVMLTTPRDSGGKESVVIGEAGFLRQSNREEDQEKCDCHSDGH